MNLRAVALLLVGLPLAASTAEKPQPGAAANPVHSHDGNQLVARHDCDDLLADPRLKGMRLVEAESAGTGLGAFFCSYAPAEARSASASTGSPIPGKRVRLNTVNGNVEIRDVIDTRPPVDPGDAGPTSPRPD